MSPGVVPDVAPAGERGDPDGAGREVLDPCEVEEVNSQGARCGGLPRPAVPARDVGLDEPVHQRTGDHRLRQAPQPRRRDPRDPPVRARQAARSRRPRRSLGAGAGTEGTRHGIPVAVRTRERVPPGPEGIDDRVSGGPLRSPERHRAQVADCPGKDVGAPTLPRHKPAHDQRVQGTRGLRLPTLTRRLRGEVGGLPGLGCPHHQGDRQDSAGRQADGRGPGLRIDRTSQQRIEEG